MTFSWCCIKASLCGSVGILLWAALVVLVVISAVFITLRTWIRWRARSLLPHLRIPLPDGKAPIIAGFFHPYCNAGGGGERVLWVAVRALQKKYKHVHCVVYTGDTDASGTEIIQRARERFNLHLPRPVEFVFLHRRKWVEAAPYAYFTLLGQSLGSIVLGWEALTKCLPHVYIDTMGYAFTLPLFRYLGGCKVGCYVHYPTISTDMLQKVSDRTTAHNNREFITKSPLISHLKLIYYRLFACVYGLAGRQSMVILVNSSWTFGHILGLWQASERTHVVYPPCDTNEFLKLPLQDEASRRTHSIVSVAQFRPEKDHPLQLRAFRTFLSIQPEENKSHYKLVLVGSCRNDEDHKRVEDLKKLGEQLGITEHVQFKLNVSFSDLKKSINEATIGLHTMWNEHFGIGVVELMAGGPVVLAHDSGGPKLDIVVDYNKQQTGFLACDEESYAKAMDTIIKMSPKQRLDIRRNARESVIRFSEAEFETGFLDAMENIWET